MSDRPRLSVDARRAMRTSVVSIGVAVAVTAAVLVAGVLTVTALYLWLQSTPAERREPPKPGDLTLSIDAGHVLLGLALVGGAAVVIAGVATLFIARRAVRPLEDAFDRQRRFVADASHELRTPLTVLHARIQLLSRRVGPDSEAAPLVRELTDDAQDLIRIVNDLLAASDGPTAPPEVPTASAIGPAPDGRTDVHAVLEDAVLAARSSTSVAPLGVVVDSVAEPLAVRIPTAALRQCLLALLENALRHSPAGGTVRVTVARTGRFAAVDVHDDGPALSAAEAARLFDRFAHRPPSSGATRPGSALRPAPALGLFPVRETVAHHGGSVAVVPTTGPEAGTTIRLLLPVA
ncbi:sensor histidine kinase [Cellulomonas sp. SG140]|uniref:sensor histidine kinase n=1 Tax=Cellulomonas sp. SG140 TaxID=2976536 RepID=UPI0021E7A2AE|nr:HAMP domain-containing sensor histidine kinase [Cellulomonas sp. SG140]